MQVEYLLKVPLINASVIYLGFIQDECTSKHEAHGRQSTLARVSYGVA